MLVEIRTNDKHESLGQRVTSCFGCLVIFFLEFNLCCFGIFFWLVDQCFCYPPTSHPSFCGPYSHCHCNVVVGCPVFVTGLCHCIHPQAAVLGIHFSLALLQQCYFCISKTSCNFENAHEHKSRLALL